MDQEKSGNNLNILSKVSLPKYLKEGSLKPNAIVIAPQCYAGYSWDLNAVMSLINYITDFYNWT